MTSRDPKRPAVRGIFGGRVLVLGAARSGRAAGRLLVAQGAQVTLYDRNPDALRDLDFPAETVSGAQSPDWDAFDVVVQSPGVPAQAHPKLMPEVDLAALALAEQRWICVTGSNGKSSVTTLIGEMLRHAGARVAVGGNIGTALCALVDEPCDVVVAELSSFQLEHASKLHPRVAVLLNLAPNHLDRHPDVASYGAAKERLAQLQHGGDGDRLVVNLDDEWARSVASRAPAPVLGASLHSGQGVDAWIEDGRLRIVVQRHDWLDLAVSDLSPAIRRYPLNGLTAALAAYAAGVRRDVSHVLKTFVGLPHRAQHVAEIRGVTYVNDSKATSPAAAIGSFESEVAPVVWLLGGVNKGVDLRVLIPCARRARAVITFGRAGDEIARALEGIPSVTRVTGLADAVREATTRAHKGDVVLLAPACASFDEFRSFEDRGDHFAEYVRSLPC